jgi:hypothetical protein
MGRESRYGVWPINHHNLSALREEIMDSPAMIKSDLHMQKAGEAYPEFLAGAGDKRGQHIYSIVIGSVMIDFLETSVGCFGVPSIDD